MVMSDAKPPYKTLGERLRSMRQRFNESLPETSGAVEIDPEALDQIERGYELPSEDILLLLINHFGIHDDEAVTLWQLAGYDKDDIAEQTDINPKRASGGMAKQALLMVLAMDARVIYTDSLEIQPGKTGIVLNFMQSAESNEGHQNVPVSRVGMSYEQAEKVLEQLQRALLYKKYASGPKYITGPDNNRPH